MFSTLTITNFNFSVSFILSTANAFNLDQSKILSFGKELNMNQMTGFALFQLYISRAVFFKVIGS